MEAITASLTKKFDEFSVRTPNLNQNVLSITVDLDLKQDNVNFWYHFKFGKDENKFAEPCEFKNSVTASLKKTNRRSTAEANDHGHLDCRLFLFYKSSKRHYLIDTSADISIILPSKPNKRSSTIADALIKNWISHPDRQFVKLITR